MNPAPAAPLRLAERPKGRTMSKPPLDGPRYIRPGTRVMRDMGMDTWPIAGVDVNLSFEAYPTSDRIALVAPGFGHHLDYGSGAMYCNVKAIRKTPIRNKYPPHPLQS